MMKKAISMIVLMSFIAITTLASLPKKDAICETDVAFNKQLPLSHPQNRCAIQQGRSVSWLSWLVGSTNAYQFHYLDLFELLSRNSDSAPNTASRT